MRATLQASSTGIDMVVADASGGTWQSEAKKVRHLEQTELETDNYMPLAFI
jgi:hypothetical protein